MRFGILGPIEVWHDGKPVDIGGRQQRSLLAALLLHANTVVSADHLQECLWGQAPPARAQSLLQGCVSRLRRVLGSQALITRHHGYVLRVPPAELDADQFELLATEAARLAAAGALEQAADGWQKALSLWRGPRLDDAVPQACRVEADRIEQRRLAVMEERIDVELRLGRYPKLSAELGQLVALHPLRERLWAQLMTALYGAGRQAEALAAYRELRRTLVEELGVEPSAAVQRLERDILSGATLSPEPPTRSGPVPAMLPPAVAAFTGRTEHLSELDRLLADIEGVPATAVVISAIAGTAGVGKTALAVHFGHRIRDHFPDGQLYLNLRGYALTPPLRPIDALAAFLHALGVATEQVPVDEGEATGLYRSLLSNRRMLVLLDNAHSAEQVRPLLPGNPECFVLITSRDRLAGLVAHDGARRLTLDVLSPDEARILLARLLGMQRVAAEPDAAADLAQACAHLPLALRIASANLLDRPHQSIARYVAELRDEGRLAMLRAGQDDPSAVRAVLDSSYHRMGPDLQRVFRLLGLVPGPEFTVADTAALSLLPPSQARQMLERLAEVHMIAEQSAGRYGFHDLLRLYAAEHVQESERAGAIERLLDGYLYTADAAARLLYPQALRLKLPSASREVFVDAGAALSWLDAERPGLIAACTYAARHGHHSHAWMLADVLRGYFWLRMHTIDWLTAAKAGLGAAQAAGDLQAQAAAGLNLADAHQRLSQYPQALAGYHEALALTRKAQWQEGEAAALGNLGNVYWRCGQLEAAAEHLGHALSLNRRIGRLPGQANSLGNLGLVEGHLGRLATAADRHRQALALHRQLGSRMGEATDLINLGHTCFEQGLLDDARGHLELALVQVRQIGDRANEADALRLMAAIHRDRSEYARAFEVATEALALARDTGDGRVEADALCTLASIELLLGRAESAVDAHQRAVELARKTENRYPESEALIGLASSQLSLRRFEVAETCAAEALDIATRTGYRMLEGQALTALARIGLESGDRARATSLAREALAIHRETGHRRGLLEARNMLENIEGYGPEHEDHCRRSDRPGYRQVP